MSGPWPTPLQEQLLAACFDAQAPIPAAVPLDASTLQLLPLLYSRRPDAGGVLMAQAKAAYLVSWRQNRERLERLSALVADFEAAGIPVMVLKGAALAERYYKDPAARSMRDFDILVKQRDLEPAIARLFGAGYTAEKGAAAAGILRQARVSHAWQFSGAGGQTCDLHWRPVVHCYSPEVARLFWEGAEARVPCATDQLFHVCAHGLEWDWSPQVRWVADALTVLREPVDWERLRYLAEEACMRVRVSRALGYLRERFGAAVPEELPGRLGREAPAWERREYALLSKPCPLGVADSCRWHTYHFRRIRRFDAGWSARPAWSGFAEYVAAFLGARGAGELLRAIAREVRRRLV